MQINPKPLWDSLGLGNSFKGLKAGEIVQVKTKG